MAKKRYRINLDISCEKGSLQADGFEYVKSGELQEGHAIATCVAAMFGQLGAIQRGASDAEIARHRQSAERIYTGYRSLAIAQSSEVLPVKEEVKGCSVSEEETDKKIVSKMAEYAEDDEEL